MIVNGGFESGSAEWKFYSANGGRFTAETPGFNSAQSAQLKITKGSGNIQFYQRDIALLPHTEYELRFEAFSAEGHDLAIILHEHDQDYTNYGLNRVEIDLGTGWQTHVVRFTTSGFNSPVDDGRLRFWLSGYAGTNDIYRIDNVQLAVRSAEVSTPTATAISASPTPILPTATTTPPLPVPTPTATAIDAPTATATPTSTPAIEPATATPTSTAEPNAEGDSVIVNGSFEDGTDGWKFSSGGKGSLISAETGVVGSASGQLTIRTTDRRMQLFQSGVALQPNTDYRLRFWARSTDGRDFHVSLIEHDQDFTTYGFKSVEFDLSDEWQLFELDFTISGFNSPVNDGRLRFWFSGYARNGDVYELDDIVLAPITAEIPAPPSLTPTSTPTVSPTPTLPADVPTPTPTAPVAPTATATPSVLPTPTVSPTSTVSAPADGPNLIANGDFEAGSAEWKYYSAGGGKFSAEADGYNATTSARLTVNNRSSNIQFYQTGIPLEPATRYRLRFAARSNSGADLAVYVHEHDDDHTNYGLDRTQFDLSAEWQTFEIEFTTSGFGAPVDDARLRIWLSGMAKSGDRYWLDDVELVALP